MTISKDDLVQRKEQITKDFEALSKEIESAETKIKQMRNNLNVFQRCATMRFVFKQIEEKR